MKAAKQIINGKEYTVGIDEAKGPDASVEARVPPSAADIDIAIRNYENWKQVLDTTKKRADDAKKSVIFLVDHFGHCPAGAPQSKRLDGLRNTATITRGTSVSMKESAVLTLALAIGHIPGLFARLFTSTTKHTLAKGAADTIKSVDMPERKLQKVLSLFGQCFDVKTNEPSLSVSVINAEKPAKQPRATKAVA